MHRKIYVAGFSLPIQQLIDFPRVMKLSFSHQTIVFFFHFIFVFVIYELIEKDYGFIA